MNDTDIHSSRIVDAERSTVFRAHEDPSVLRKWWGPSGFSSTFHEYDFRSGGRWRFTFHGPDGKNYENEWIFREIVEDQLIDLDHVCAPFFRLRIKLAAEGDRTRVDWHATFESAEVLADIRHIIVPSNEENFDRLEAVLVRMG